MRKFYLIIKKKMPSIEVKPPGIAHWKTKRYLAEEAARRTGMDFSRITLAVEAWEKLSFWQRLKIKISRKILPTI